MMKHCLYHKEYHPYCALCQKENKQASHAATPATTTFYDPSVSVSDDDDSSLLDTVVAAEIAADVFNTPDPIPDSTSDSPSFDSDNACGGDSGGGGASGDF